MKINDYDYVEPKGVNGKIFITSFPGLDENGIFQELNFQTQLNILQKNNCSSITSFVQDKEFESVSLSLKIPIYKMFWRVTLPVCLPPIFDISIYLFVNAMTTVSGVIFIYSYDTTLASVSSIHLDEQGDVAAAAAMAMLIVYVSIGVRLTHTIITKGILSKTQAWRYNVGNTN